MARFERDARVLASLNHPNIAAIYGLEELEGAAYLVMELVPSANLATRIHKGPLPLEDSLASFRRSSRKRSPTGSRTQKSTLR